MTRLVYKNLSSFSPLDHPDPWDDGETRFVVLSKNAEGEFEEFGSFTSASEAWNARRNYATHNPTRKFFLRKQRVYVVGPTSPEAAETSDLWREAFRTGRDHLVPADQWKDYQCWVAKKVEARQAYARFDRDAPRWEGTPHPPSLGGEFQAQVWGN